MRDIDIYIYRERKGERDIERGRYIYRERERET